MNTILAVDDHPLVLEGLKKFLQKNGYNVLTASTPKEAVNLATNVPAINAYVIDMALNEPADGLTLAKTLQEKDIRRPTVIYTMHEELWNIRAMEMVDVEGIVLKGEDLDELLQAIRMVEKGKTYRSPHFHNRYSSVMKSEGILSTLDTKVLYLLSTGNSSREIAKELFISEKAVEYHRSNILRKLNSRTMNEAIIRAMHLGILK